MFTDFKDSVKWSESFTKDSDFQARVLSILRRKPAREWPGEPMELTVGLRGMLDL
jgi:hypothetical protein